MIDLDKLKPTYQKVYQGASGKYKLNLYGEEYFFKENYADYEQDIVEVFVSQIFEKLKIDNFVKYEFATFKRNNGCLCKSFIDYDVVNQITLADLMCGNFFERESGKHYPIDYEYSAAEFHTFFDSLNFSNACQFDFTCEQIVGEVERFATTHNMSVDCDALYNRLCELVVIDYFIANGDRHWCNLLFLVKEDDNDGETIDISPIFDNGESFAFNSSCIKEDNDLNYVVLNIGLSDVGKVSTLEENNYLKNGGLTIVDIYTLAKQNDKIKNLVDSFLNFDIDNELKEFISREKVAVPVEVANQIKFTFNNRKERYLQVTNKLEKRLEKADKTNKEEFTR